MSNFRTTENSYRGRDIWREVLGSAEGTALQMVEVTEGNLLWMSSHYSEVVAWLTEHAPAAAAGDCQSLSQASLPLLPESPAQTV